MADQRKSDFDPPDRSDERAARRESRRRRVRGQRIGAAVALAVGVGALTISLVDHSGHSSPDPSRSSGPRERTSSRIPGTKPFTSQADWEPHPGPVPILEYHVLGSPEPGVAYPELYVARPDFRHQLEWLDEHGYQAVTLEQVEQAWYHGGVLPAKPVVLSFDDGYRPQFTFALPQLRKHGWAGVLNLKAEGSDLYESNVKAMIGAGWELAAHTIHHLDLTELDAAQLREEVSGSRAILRREYGVPVPNFCYPAGRFDETVVAAVKAAGYRGATTEIPGYAESDSPYELARFEILGSTGVSGLAEDLNSG